MPLFIIDSLQYLVDALLIFLPIFYTFSILYLIYSLIIHKKLGRRFKIWLLAGPFIFALSLVAFIMLLNQGLASARYSAWTSNCGHEPVIGVRGTFEPTRTAYSGALARDYKDQASQYFCSTDEAKAEGYFPL